jgi:excinuclease ABC subunit A
LHELRVIAASDWVIDMGPGAGTGGGRIVARGTPASIVDNAESVTGRYLGEMLARRPLG